MTTNYADCAFLIYNHLNLTNMFEILNILKLKFLYYSSLQRDTIVLVICLELVRNSI